MSNFVGLYQNAHLGGRVHGLNIIISISGHFVSRCLKSDSHILVIAIFSIQHNPLRLRELLTKKIQDQNFQKGTYFSKLLNYL